MHRVAHSTTVDVPVETCFRYVDDFDNAPRFIYGMKSFTPVGPSIPRLGTAFEARMQFGPVKFTLGGVICEHRDNEVIAISLDNGPLTGKATWRFAGLDTTSTAMSMDVDYQIGRGLTGRALAAVIDSIVSPAIKYTDAQLCKQLLSIDA